MTRHAISRFSMKSILSIGNLLAIIPTRCTVKRERKFFCQVKECEYRGNKLVLSFFPFFFSNFRFFLTLTSILDHVQSRNFFHFLCKITRPLFEAACHLASFSCFRFVILFYGREKFSYIFSIDRVGILQDCEYRS